MDILKSNIRFNEKNIIMNSKLPDIPTTIFTIMSKMAHDHNAINLSQGFPDFSCSGELIGLVHKYMKEGYNQYAPMFGVPELREAISEKTRELYSREYDPEKEINITAGATQAIYTAITALVHEDDEVLVFEPAYDSYVPAIKINNGQPVYVQLKEPDYTIDWGEVEKAINSRTKMMILNSPHNPTGSALSASDLEELRKLIKGTNIMILSDEVYEHITFNGMKHQSMALHPELAERSIIISSFGKVFHTTGWKVGYCLAPEMIMNEFRKVHQFNVFAVNTPVQYAIAEFLKNKNEYLKLNKFYEQKRNLFNDLFKETGFIIRPSRGTYFQLLDYSGITDIKDTVFAEKLTKEYGVASIPVSVFYHEKIDNKVLRFCFAKEDKTLEQAAEKLREL